MRPFHIYKRPNGVYYAKAIEIPSGRILCTRSTGTRDRFKAMLKVAEWTRNGIPQRYGKTSRIRENTSQIINTGNLTDEQALKLLQQLQVRLGVPSVPIAPVNQEQWAANTTGTEKVTQKKSTQTHNLNNLKLIDWLTDFWNPKTSKYIREKRAHGHSVGERHCYEMTNRVKNYWKSYFFDTLVGGLDGEELSDFFLELREVNNLSGATINKIMNAGAVAFKWAFEHKKLSENFALRMMRFAVGNKERGILTEDEAQKLFAREWKDNRAKVANLLAMTTGMRAGEILALRPCDINETYINVLHSWNDKDGLKDTKNHHSRKVPLIPPLRKMLLQLASSNPHGMSPSYFVFYSTLPDKPIVINILLENLVLELQNIGISDEERQERNIVFHSWRHYYATQMTKRVELAQAQAVLGHLTPEMTKHYANHKTIKDLEVIEQAVNEAFANIVIFSRIT